MSLATQLLEAFAAAEQKLQALPEMQAVSFDLDGHPTLTRVEITRDLIAYRMTFYKGDALVAPETVYPEGLGETLPLHRTDSGFKDLPLEGAGVVLSGLFNDIRDAKFQALFEAALELGADQHGGIDRYTTMCEPGYAKADVKGYLVANWNYVDNELAQWLEDEGYDSGHWSDEWSTCCECGGLIRTQADSYSWKRYYMEGPDFGLICGDCLKKDIPAYLAEFEGKANAGITLDVDPAQHGYLRVNQEGYGTDFENGWHPGQDADPKAMSKTLRLNGILRFLWMITSVGQFDVHFALYIHEEAKDDLPKVRELLGIQ